VSIIDHHSRRHAIDPVTIEKYLPTTHYSLANPAGTINPDFADHFLSALRVSGTSNSTQVIAVEGEEDLLTLPALLLSPLNAYVIYGQHNVGMCVVKVTEEIKSLAKKLLTEFA
jgi:hypothetical protein